MTRLCLNMIVKNEVANLPRCLTSVADHIDSWVIGDTGSTDGTQDYIGDFFRERGIEGELHEFPFYHFERARNTALDYASVSPLKFDYLLFADADMELVVEDRAFGAKLLEPSYRLQQRCNSGLSYWNTRLIMADVGARYRGVTHEYLDVPGQVQNLDGAWFIDHADGSNRSGKFERDIELLLDGIRHEPDNARYWFYLAQSYRDLGRHREAAVAYAKRADMGGWDEEAWSARLEEARALLKTGDEGRFVQQAIKAFDQRPHRAEPLYDLARYYREQGMNHASLAFSERGLKIPYPNQDSLFIEDFVYSTGLREEFSIAAFYDPNRCATGHATCDALALSRTAPKSSRDLARSNLYFYTRQASELMPSFKASRLEALVPDGLHLSSSSICMLGQSVMLCQRAVNYEIDGSGRYVMKDGEPIRTRNYLLCLDELWKGVTEILPPDDFPPRRYDLVVGFEDMRIFEWHGDLWSISNCRELTREGWCQQVLAKIHAGRLTGWRVWQPDPGRHEKNWMPLVDGDKLEFIYLCDPTKVIDENGNAVAESIPDIACEQFRGGSQAIPFKDGWLALVHEVLPDKGPQGRTYEHRFIWLDADKRLRKVSPSFYFNRHGIEFAAGLVRRPGADEVMISYSVNDGESWVATVCADDVSKLLS